MLIEDYLSKDYVGQAAVKGALNFYISGQRKLGVLPPLFFHSPKGHGKSMLARLVGDNLLNPAGKPKKFIECNGSSVRKLDAFVEVVVKPHIADQDSTLFIDEIDSCSDPVLNWLLSVIQPNQNHVSVASHGGEQFVFDYRRFSFISASTNAERLRAPLKNRLTRLEFSDYKKEEIIEILKKNCQSIIFVDDVECEIADITRGSPRVAAKIGSEDILCYAAQSGKQTFGRREWKHLRQILGINILGLTAAEIRLMKFLVDGPKTLQCIASFMGMDTKTIRRDIEAFLLGNQLITIEGKRFISEKGKSILGKIKDEN